ncbi:MAG: large subunit ribosomal protein [Miltoncostaeaceae bacterium]|nr:large subunit ribosomal protein [Miltoncostaeaceae bacterium]
MSRIGRAPIPLPDGVTVTIEGQTVSVAGPRGNLRHVVVEPIRVLQDDGVLRVERPTDRAPHRALHGLSRSLVANMVEGVSAGFERRLEIVGVGYRATLRGAALDLAVGYSHIVTIDPPEGISFEVPVPTQVIVRGIDKQAVGQMAARIRQVRPPEPYKGKGIRYAGEAVRRKVGKRA